MTNLSLRTLIALAGLALACGGTGPTPATSSPRPPEELPAGCSVERPCPAAPPGRWGLSYCYAPGEMQPCGPAGCDEMQRRCYLGPDGKNACAEGFACEGGTCVPRTCAATVDCQSPNLACRDKTCVHRTCARSVDCGTGTCIHGECFLHAGACYYPPDTPLP